MSTTQRTLTAQTAAPTGVGDRSRARVVAAVLTLGVLLDATLVLWQPWGERDDFSYASLAEHRTGAWLGGILDGVAVAAIGLGLGLAACLLVRGRGRTAATVGALLTSLGGVLFAGGSTAFGVLAWYVTEPEALSPDAGTNLMTYVDDNLDHLIAVSGAGFVLLTLGALTLMAALWRARVVPVWLPVSYLVLTVGVFASTGTVMNVVQAAQTLLLAGVAAVLVTAERA